MEDVDDGGEGQLKEGLYEGTDDGTPQHTAEETGGEAFTALALTDDFGEEESKDEGGEEEPCGNEDTGVVEQSEGVEAWVRESVPRREKRGL